MIRLLAPVVQIESLSAPRHFVLTLHAPEIAHTAQPGQFVAVAAPESLQGAQLLRRPFSVYTVEPASGNIAILFSVYGVTTNALSLSRVGDSIDIIGPLGGRPFLPDGNSRTHHVLIGGGYGIPPLAFFARSLKDTNAATPVTLIDGARTRNLLVGTDGLAERGVSVVYCTDDGSYGLQGRVTAALEPILQEDAVHTRVYTCGPTPMMRAVAEMTLSFGARCEVSMEPFMPCGIGICMGCAVPLNDGTFARGCTDGPVFAAEAVQWN